MKKTINIGLAGYGTVGKGVMSLLLSKNEDLSARAGAKLRIKRVCDKKFADKEKDKAGARRLSEQNKGDPGLLAEGKVYTPDIEDIFNDPEIDIFVELIGGYQPAKRFILLALERGMDVVTANKNVLAKDFNELLSAAAKNKRRIYFEATAGAGIPIIAAINEGFCANEIYGLAGILNGTTNYILSEMSSGKAGFSESLKKAQKLGFAEADPTLDITGGDSASKLAILSSLIFKSHIKPSDIYTQGIEKIQPFDIKLGGELGYTIKLFTLMEKVKPEQGKASAKEGVTFQVVPAFIKSSHPLASVSGAFNAVYIKSDAAGEQMLYGPGAGSLPAASAVVSDIVYSARHIMEKSALHMPFFELKKKPPRIADAREVESCFYLRFTAEDKPGVLARIADILADHGISVASVVQKDGFSPKAVPIVVLTHEARTGDLINAIGEIDKLKMVKEKTVYYRLLDI
ncbi:MAG: homoserine dehydrogenase [Elusimicrobia bacterium HGW-Elusimicrobia-2]|nr:MAG: homoserine dehydrogenase [Elusimicrobia bacterium HGW-Elusimicrobia-2]